MAFKFAVIAMLLLSSTVVAAEPATKADIQALDAKVNEMDKRLIRLETKVDEMDKRLVAQIQAIQIAVTEMDKRLTARIDVLFWAIGSLIGIVLAVIVLLQILGYFQDKRERENFQKQLAELQQQFQQQQREIEELKSRRIVTPS